MSGAAGGVAVGALAATVINSVIRSRYSKEHEKEADRIGTELALARGFDPEEEVRFSERQHERFGKRSLSPKIGNSLFGSHPRDRVRGREPQGAARCGPEVRDRRQADCWWTGCGYPALRQPSARRSSRRSAGKGRPTTTTPPRMESTTEVISKGHEEPRTLSPLARGLGGRVLQRVDHAVRRRG